ncbi:MAG: heavy metal translocating P-type ATPase [Pseudomonadota bacterium]
MTTADICALCGLPITHGARTLSEGSRTLRFCCIGCRQVYTILAEAGIAGDAAASELFQECRSLGIIPTTTADLDRLAGGDAPGSSGEPAGTAGDDSLPLAIAIHGMWCPACAWVIQRAVSGLPGVTEATSHFSSDRLSCRYDPRRRRPADIIAAVDRLGYRAALVGESESRGFHRRAFIRFSVCALLTMNIMMLSAALYTGFVTNLDADSIFKISLPMFLLAVIVYGYGGQPIFMRAAAGLRARAFGMETLIAIAATSAFAYSTVNLIRGSIHLYFDTCAMLITLVLLGQILEQRAKAAVHSDLGAFSALVPAKVRLCTTERPEGRYVPALRLASGDMFRLSPGEAAVADGVVISGDGTMDESTLTGEPRPVGKGPGSPVISGCTVVDGDLRVRALQVGPDTTLMQMIRIMQAALAVKTSHESRTEQWLLYFVPTVIALAVFTAVGTAVAGLGGETALIRAVTVLVIACPCALGVAVPLARVAGVSMAARQGILVRDFDAFETAAGVSALILDKTGTVTTGRWRLLGISAAPGIAPDTVLAMAAALETASRHPIAEEIRRNARERCLEIPAASEITAHTAGVTGRIGGSRINIGNARFTGAGNPLPRTLPLSTDPDGVSSAVYISEDDRLIGTLHFGDRLRPGMKLAVDSLAREGLSLSLLSGDAPSVTRQVAQQIGILSAEGGLSPEAKASRVKTLQIAGAGVAMIGDGINDAPALAAADLAVTVFSGNALDAEVADISLMRSHPEQLLDFLQIARRVRCNIHQNLALSFVYNLLMIPVAMTGLLSPVVAVIAMLLSSLSVIGNTLRMMRQSQRQPGQGQPIAQPVPDTAALK